MVLGEARELSFAHPNTEFYLPSYPRTYSSAGIHNGEPTGEVVCVACWESHMNVDEIEHESTCPQRHVHSRYYRSQQ
ncbi:hypothetical protein G9C85_02555 [Halorubellus sp. JP-L1]|uniref:hypothetical protein n=1 Tax=Halorubellus sp. JP-L1 TaxID=2715753 RepID=UPI001409FE0C|nr:hypothetical protein [Halorubellus sp. JP-L1]NHN40519.1 hypothetical protein [Halorubellus sp. JP-L1]